MATYYDYQKRDDKSQIDWAATTREISEGLYKVSRDREQAKADLEKGYQEDVQKVNEYEAGLDPTANEFALKSSQDTKNLLHENYKAMKKGYITVNDAQLFKQKSVDNWTNLSTALKGYNATFKTLSETPGKGNMAIMEDLAQSLDLKNKKFYQNPETGEGYLATLDDQGRIDMNKLQPIRSLINQQRQKYEYVDVNANVEKDTKNAAIWKAAITSTNDIEDVRQNPEFKSWKENKIKATLSSDRATSSVLMDYLDYSYTTDPEDKDPNKILMKRDSVGVLQPVVTPEQRKAAEDAYGNALEMALGHKETKQYVAPRVERTATENKQDKKDKRTVGVIDDFVVNGNYSALKSKLIESGAQSIEMSPDETSLTIVTGDGSTVGVDLTGGAKQVGQQLAGAFGTSDLYNELSKATEDPVNELIKKASYGPIVKPKVVLKEISKDTKENLRNSLDATLDAFNKEGFTPQMFIQQAKEVISSAVQEAGLDPNLLDVSDTGWVTYNGKNYGSIHPQNGKKLTGAQILSLIQNTQKEATSESNQKPKSGVNLNANTRNKK